MSLAKTLNQKKKNRPKTEAGRRTRSTNWDGGSGNYRLERKERVKSAPFWLRGLFWVSVLFFFASIMPMLWYRTQTLHLRFRNAAEYKQQQVVNTEVGLWMRKISLLKEKTRIEIIAHGRGMSEPTREQMIRLRD